MSVSYNYSIQKLVTENRQGLERVVVSIVYTASATDSGLDYTVSVNGSVDLATPSSTFTDFLELSQAQVMSWLTAALSSEQIAHDRAQLEARLTAYRQYLATRRTLVTHMPWDGDTGEEPVKDQQLFVYQDVETIVVDTTAPGCYQLNPDGTVRAEYDAQFAAPSQG